MYLRRDRLSMHITRIAVNCFYFALEQHGQDRRQLLQDFCLLNQSLLAYGSE